MADGIAVLRHRPHGLWRVWALQLPGHLPNGILSGVDRGYTVVFKPSEFAPGVAALTVILGAGRLARWRVKTYGAGREGHRIALAIIGRSMACSSPAARIPARCCIGQFGGRPEIVLALKWAEQSGVVAEVGGHRCRCT